MELPYWGRVKEDDSPEQRFIKQMLVGISSREYGRSLENVGDELESVTTSRSSPNNSRILGHKKASVW